MSKGKHEILPVDLGKALKDERERRTLERHQHYSQDEAAREMGVSLAAVRKWETGDARPKARLMVEAVQRFLNHT